VALLEQALGAVEHLPKGQEALERAVDLRLSLSAPLSTLGELDRARAILGEAEHVAGELGDRRRLGWVLGVLATTDFLAAEYAAALEHGKQALESAQVTGDVGLQVVSAEYLGLSHYYLGRFLPAIESCREALALLEGARRRERYGMRVYPASVTRSVIAVALAQLGEFGEAIRYAEEAREIAEEIGHAYTQSITLGHIADVYLLHGQLGLARSAAEQAVRFAQEADSPQGFRWNASRLGAALIEAGRVDEGLPWLERAVETATRLRIKQGLSSTVSRRAEGYLYAGRRTEAIEQGHRALGIARTQSERVYEAWTLRLLGEIYTHGERGDVAAADDSYRQALSLAKELGMRPLVAHCHLGLGKLYRRAGQLQEAQEHLTTATTMYHEMDMRFWLDQAEAEMRELR